MPSVAKKSFLRKEYRKQLLSSLQNTKPTQTKGSILAERIEQVTKPKYELKLMKIVDYFLHGYGIYKCILVIFIEKL